MEADEVLDRAADLLMIYGRCRGTGQRDDGSFCVNGAIQHVQGEKASGIGLSHPRQLLDRYLAAHPEVIDPYHRYAQAAWIERGRFPAWAWNDTTLDDDLVIDTLRRCAKELRG